MICGRTRSTARLRSAALLSLNDTAGAATSATMSAWVLRSSIQTRWKLRASTTIMAMAAVRSATMVVATAIRISLLRTEPVSCMPITILPSVPGSPRSVGAN